MTILKTGPKLALLAAVAGIAAGCVTTEKAGEVIATRWTGQPGDAFFGRYGPPRSSFPLANGDVIHTWRGGETTRTIPAQYAPIAAAPALGAPPPAPAFGNTGFGTTGFGNTGFGAPPTAPATPAPATPAPIYEKQVVRSETRVETPSPGVTRTTTTTTTRGASIGYTPPAAVIAPLIAPAPVTPAAPPGQRLVAPARTEQLFCELQITVDTQSAIRSIRIARDTPAAGIGLSRCAEVLDVK